MRVLATFLCVLTPWVALHAEQPKLHKFQRQQLTKTYFSEGANAGDVNRDGVADVVYGPYWFAGPEFKQRREIYEPVPQDTSRYANNFFSWVYDFNGDGWQDVLTAGFPGTPAYVYENPQGKFDDHWKKHQVFDWVSNESPQLVNLLGDDRPELICTRDGFFGFVTINDERPFSDWKFHPISAKITATRFGHGLGVGDVNGDGRQDILHAKGWFEQPNADAETSRWPHHETSFSNSYGGADMFAYDVDGDGDNDVITSHAAHDFGLAWYEQLDKPQDGKEIPFRHHLIMGNHPSQNKYGVLFSELHSVNLVDMDGDGLKDIVTGKTFWSHHKQSPMWDAGAVVYWFKLVRGEEGVEWVPYQADGEAGIGRQLTVTDLNKDGLPDIVAGGMRGAHVLMHKTESVSHEQWKAAQPKVYSGPKLPSIDNAKALRGPKAKIDADTKQAAGAIEAEALSFKTSGGSARPQNMAAFSTDRWSGDSQLYWTGARPGDQLKLKLPELRGEYDLEIVLTCARDYGIVQLMFGDQKIGDPIDLYDPKVITTGVLRFAGLKAEGDGANHTLTLQMIGSNPRAAKAYMAAIDFIRLTQQ